MNTERRIFLGQLIQRDAHLFLIRLGFRLYSDRDHRLREFHAFQGDDFLRIAERVARGDFLQADGRRDVARANFFNFFPVVGVHLHDTTDTFATVLHRIEYGVAGIHHTGINAEEGESPDERVGGDFERQSRKR